ncbi:MAG TPA: GntR family transcriptional regulator [bacterium]|nr:GntR family transcriptional regulator [bacterium]HOL35043.1 GntR family transcriptional regulator [bacterium]HPP07862.1 GntR family transcriptional regulator [bacterium]
MYNIEKMNIKINGPVPLSKQVKENIRFRIETFVYKPDEKIPSEENIAKEFCVSRMTARQAIIELINEKLLYRIPGRGTFVASGLAATEAGQKGHSSVIMVIAPNLKHSFYYQIISNVEKTMTRNGLNIILRSANEERHEEEHCLNDALNLGVIGIILIAGKYSTYNCDIIEKIRRKIPIVSVDVAVRGVNIDLVASDDRNGGFLSTEHLIELGHKNILHLAGPKGDSSAEARLQGYVEALKNYNIKVRQTLIRPTEWRFEDGYYQTKKFFLNGEGASAIFACNDEVAAGAYRALREIGISVPDKVAIIGYGNLEIGRCMEIPLTTIDQNADEMGKAASETLLEKIKNKEKILETREVIIKTKLVIRDSCGIKSRQKIKITEVTNQEVK